MRAKWIVILLLVLAIPAIAIWSYLQRHRHDELRIGAIFDLTGSLSYMGQWSLEGAKLAESEINASGGVDGRPIRLIVDDAETKADRAALVFQRMINVEHLPVVIGFNGSSEAMACAPIADRTHVVLFSTGAASPTVTTAGDFVFRNRLSGAFEASRMAELARDPLHLENAAILFINTDYGRGYADAFEQRFRGLGGTIKVRAGFAQDQTDFRAQLAQIQNTPSIDFVYLASHVREAASILRQAADLGLRTRWLASNAVEAPELFTIAGNAAEGVILTVEAYDPTSTASRTFNAAYKKAYGRDSEMFAAHAYDAVKLFAQELGKANGHPENLRDALYNIKDWPGASGPTTFDKNGDVIKAVSIKVAQGGRFKAITNEQLVSLFSPSPLKQ